jgi:hypothetical protein
MKTSVLGRVFVLLVSSALTAPVHAQQSAEAPPQAQPVDPPQTPVSQPPAPAPAAQPAGPVDPATPVFQPVAVAPTPPPVSVQQPIPTPAPKERSGLFLAGDLGIAGHSTGRDNATVTGAGLNVRLAAGVMATPRFALFGGFSYFESLTLTLEEGGTSVDTDEITLSATSLFGGGRLYTASDFYFEATLGSLKQSAKENSTGLGGTSQMGVLGLFGLGKEWSLPSGLTIAAGGRIGVGSIPARDGGSDPTVVHFDLCLGLGYAGGR